MEDIYNLEKVDKDNPPIFSITVTKDLEVSNKLVVGATFYTEKEGNCGIRITTSSLSSIPEIMTTLFNESTKLVAENKKV